MQNYTGEGFLCLGDSHRFIDPIFVYGAYFGIQEGEFATEAIARYLSGEVKSNGNPFADFDEGQEVVEDVIGALWEYRLAFQRIMAWRDKVDSLDLLAGSPPMQGIMRVYAAAFDSVAAAPRSSDNFR